MSVYENIANAQAVQKEIHLYGSSRLGMLTDLSVAPTSTLLTGGFGNANFSTFTRGEKIFELSNHLGNVLVTISDKKIGVDSDNDNIINYYNAEVITASDVYPFGMNIPGRSFNTSRYRYGFNGIEKETDCGCGEIFAATFRNYDARIARWLSVDPMADDDVDISPYVNNENNPIINYDTDGDTPCCFGQLLKGLLDAGIEVAGQLASGKKISEIDLMDVGVSFVQGFVSGYSPAGWVNTSKNLIRLAKMGQKLVHYGGEVVKAGLDGTVQDGITANSAKTTIINLAVALSVEKAFKSKKASKLLKPSQETLKKALKIHTNISKQVAQKAKAVQTAVANGSKNSVIKAKVEQLKKLTGKQAESAANAANSKIAAANTAATMDVLKETTENTTQNALLPEKSQILSDLQQQGEFTNIQTSRFFNKWVNGGSDRVFLDYEGNQWQFKGKENSYDPKNIELVKRKNE